MLVLESLESCRFLQFPEHMSCHAGYSLASHDSNEFILFHKIFLNGMCLVFVRRFVQIELDFRFVIVYYEIYRNSVHKDGLYRSHRRGSYFVLSSLISGTSQTVTDMFEAP